MNLSSSNQSHLDLAVEAGWAEAPRRTKLGQPLMFGSLQMISEVLNDDRNS